MALHTSYPNPNTVLFSQAGRLTTEDLQEMLANIAQHLHHGPYYVLIDFSEAMFAVDWNIVDDMRKNMLRNTRQVNLLSLVYVIPGSEKHPLTARLTTFYRDAGLSYKTAIFDNLQDALAMTDNPNESKAGDD